MTTATLPAARSRQVFIANLIRRGTVLIFLILLSLIFSTQSDRFLTPENLVNILQQNAHIIVVTIGITLTMLVGGIDLSVGSVAALTGAISAGLIVRNGLPFELVIPLTLILGLALGLVNGAMVVYGKLPPFIATLAMMGVARGFMLLYTEGRPIANIGDSYRFLGRGTVPVPLIGDVPTPILIALAVILIFMFVLTRTRFGLHIYAIGGNIETSRLAGVPVNRVVLLTYALSGMLAALAGIMLTARLSSAQPQTGIGLELEGIAASVLGGVSLFGGVGNIPGAVIGALFMGTLGNGMNILRLPSYQQQMIQGAVLVVAVMLDMIINRLEQRE